jgi:hypothetical protein
MPDHKLAVILFCPKCGKVYRASQERFPQGRPGLFDCINCNAQVHQWRGGSGFCVSVLAAKKRGLPPVGCFTPSFAFFSMVVARKTAIAGRLRMDGRSTRAKQPSTRVGECEQQGPCRRRCPAFWCVCYAKRPPRLPGSRFRRLPEFGHRQRSFHFLFPRPLAHKTVGAELCSASGTPGDRWG